MKRCSKCGEVKSVEDFGKAKTAKDGLSSQCKECQKEYGKKYRENNKEHCAEYNKKYYEENKEKCNESMKKYREENKEYCVEKAKKYYEENKEHCDENSKKYYEENKEHCAERGKKYRENNKEKCVEYTKKYYEENKEQIFKREKQRKKTDVNFKITCNLRRRINSVLKDQSADKAYHYNEYIGCTPQELHDHLESQFTEGMTFENHGLHGWHVDHIMPCCSFDLTDYEQQKKCFNWSNLQPLWAEDNLKKGGKIL